MTYKAFMESFSPAPTHYWSFDGDTLDTGSSPEPQDILSLPAGVVAISGGHTVDPTTGLPSSTSVLSFDGSIGIELAPSDDINGVNTTAYSVNVWSRAGFGGDLFRTGVIWGQGGNARNIVLSTSGGATPIASITQSSTNFGLASGPGSQDGDIRMLTLVWSGASSEIRLYVDGELTQTAAAPASLSSHGNTPRIGRGNTYRVGDVSPSINSFAGELSHVATWHDQALTAEEVRSLYDNATVPVQSLASGTVSGVEAGSRLQVFNETTGVEIVNEVVAASTFSVSYTNGTLFSDGDVIRLRVTYYNGLDARLPFEQRTQASETGWTFLAQQLDDSVYTTNGVDGGSVVKFALDVHNLEIDLAATSNFSGQELYAFYVAQLHSEDGIRSYFRALEALDAGNYRINSDKVSVFLDNNTPLNLRQTDNSRIFRTDGLYPARSTTSGGGGIQVNWTEGVLVATVNGQSVVTGDLTTLVQGVSENISPTLSDIRRSTSLIPGLFG